MRNCIDKCIICGGQYSKISCIYCGKIKNNENDPINDVKKSDKLPKSPYTLDNAWFFDPSTIQIWNA